jgi:hypothetical protein
MAGIADEELFWVRIKKNGSDYHVDRVCEADAEGNPGEEREMIELVTLSKQMRKTREFITEMKSVEIHIMRIQTEREIKAGTNRRCVVNSRMVAC